MFLPRDALGLQRFEKDYIFAVVSSSGLLDGISMVYSSACANGVKARIAKNEATGRISFHRRGLDD